MPMPMETPPPPPGVTRQVDPVLMQPTSSDSKRLYDARMNLQSVDQQFAQGAASQADLDAAIQEVDRSM